MPNPTAEAVYPLDQTACKNIAVSADKSKKKTGAFCSGLFVFAVGCGKGEIHRGFLLT